MTISFWEKKLLHGADILIVGSGIVGLQSAIRLKEKYPQRSVWVVDRAAVSLGASLRNAGFVCFGSVGEILDDIARTDEKQAVELYRKRFAGVSLLVNEYGESILGYERTGGYEIFDENTGDMHTVTEAAGYVNNLLKDISGADTFSVVDSAKLGMKVATKALFAKYEGMLQTHLLYDTIWNKAMSLGVKIMGGFDVSDIYSNGSRWVVTNGAGYEIKCKKLLLCTNAFTRKLIPEVEIEPARGQVIITSPIPNLPWRGIFHADKGYIYFRSLGSRILIGGARNTNFDAETTYSLESTEEITGRLIEFLKTTVVPGYDFTVDEKWSGTMAMAVDRNPLINEYKPGMYIAARMGGMGVALSAFVAQQVAQLVEL